MGFGVPEGIKAWRDGDKMSTAHGRTGGVVECGKVVVESDTEKRFLRG